jgi:hypothetical protein
MISNTIKFLLASLFFSITITQNVYCQNYNQMLNDSCTWYYLSCFEGCYTVVYSTKGDTTIGEHNYKLFGYAYSGGVYGYLREDTIEKKIYNRFTEDVELLIYDFSLEIGDSILLHDYNFCTDSIADIDWYYLDSINTIPISNGTTRALFLNSPNNYQTLIWIEGIGTLGNPEVPHSSPDEIGSELSCFYKNETLIYQSELSAQYGNCDFFVNKEVQSEESINIYPNPVSDYLKISNIEAYFDLYLIDIFGNIIQHHKLNDRNIIIDLNRINNGVYILMLQNNDTIITRKIVKQ